MVIRESTREHETGSIWGKKRPNTRALWTLFGTMDEKETRAFTNQFLTQSLGQPGAYVISAKKMRRKYPEMCIYILVTSLSLFFLLIYNTHNTAHPYLSRHYLRKKIIFIPKVHGAHTLRLPCWLAFSRVLGSISPKFVGIRGFGSCSGVAIGALLWTLVVIGGKNDDSQKKALRKARPRTGE